MLAGCVPWPEDFADRYRQLGYWDTELLGDILDAGLREGGARVALVTENGATTYTQLDEKVARIASGLQRLQIAPRDRVVVQLPNTLELVAISLALFRIGAIPVFALAAHRKHEIAYICRHSEAIAYVIPGTYRRFDYLALAEEIVELAPHLRLVISTGEPGRFLALDSIEDSESATRVDIDPAEAALFLLSGSTTSSPKLIPRTHQDYSYQLRASAAAVQLKRNSVYLAALPIAHNAALGCPGVLGTLRLGGKVVLAGSPSPSEAFSLIDRERVTLTTLMPSVLKVWLESSEFLPVDLSQVLLQVGGARLDPEIGREVYRKHGGLLTQWFGMAEGFLSYTRSHDPEDVVVHTAGSPLCPADEIRVVDEMDVDVTPGQTGELLVRGPYTLRGYFKADLYNATAFTHDGYLRTGDLVSITERGDMVVEGRTKEIVNRNGEKVPVLELERQLMAHSSVLQAAVIALPDASMVEKTCAFIVADSNRLEASHVRQFLREAGLAEFKLPDHIEFVSSLPRTSSGMVDKRMLRESPLVGSAAAGR